MKLAISTALYLHVKQVNQIDFTEIPKILIKNVEIVFPVHANSYVIKTLKELNLNIFSGHADFMGVDISSLDSSIRQKSLEVIKKRILLLSSIGAEILVVHPGNFCKGSNEKYKKINFSIESLAEIASFAESQNIKIAVENMPNKYVAENPEELLYIVNEVRKTGKLRNKNTIGICFDSGHAFLTNSINDYLKKYLGDIITMHIHDNMGDSIRNKAIKPSEIDKLGKTNKLDKVYNLGKIEKLNENDKLNDNLNKTNKLEYAKNKLYDSEDWDEHYKDAPDDRHLVPGKGLINWPEMLAILNRKLKNNFKSNYEYKSYYEYEGYCEYKSNYEGWFTFEVIPDEKLNNYSELLSEINNFIKEHNLDNNDIDNLDIFGNFGNLDNFRN